MGCHFLLQLEIKAQFSKFFETEGCTSHDVLSTVNPDLSIILVGHVKPYYIKKECYLVRSCLLGARRMLLFMVEHVFLPVGEVWLRQNAEAWCTWGEREGQRAEKNFYVYISLAIRYEFCFTKSPPSGFFLRFSLSTHFIGASVWL